MRKWGSMVLGGLLVFLGALAANAEETKPQTTVDASKGGFTIQSGDNSLTFGAYVHARVTVDDKEDADADPVGSTGAGEADGTAASFDVTRARMWIRGTMWKAWLKYNVSWELSRTTGASDSKIKDAFLEFAQQPMATVRMGQFKVPFSLQELTPDQFQMFADRGITNAAFSPGRDAGVMLYGATGSKKFGYNVGLFNGAGESKTQDDEEIMYAARVYVDPMGEYKLVEGTTDNPDKNVLHIGLAVRGGEATKNPDVCTTGVGTCPAGNLPIFQDPDDQQGWNAEVAWKFKRFFATGEYFEQTTERKNPTPELTDLDSSGWHAQAGVMAIPSRLEFGVRYAVVDPNEDADQDVMSEARLVGNYFIKAHNAKIQFELAQLKFEANNPGRGTRLASAAGQDVKDKQARIQVQLLF